MASLEHSIHALLGGGWLAEPGSVLGWEQSWVVHCRSLCLGVSKDGRRDVVSLECVLSLG